MPVPIVYQNFIPPAIDAGNLNTVNNVVYTVIGDGTNAPLNAANVRTNIGLGVLATATIAPVANGGTGDSGTAWASQSTGAVTASVGTITTAAGTCRFKIIGKTVFCNISITVTTNGTGAGTILVAGVLPAVAQSATVLSGKESVSGKAVTCTVAASSLNGVIVNYDNTYPVVSGSIITINGVYESA